MPVLGADSLRLTKHCRVPSSRRPPHTAGVPGPLSWCRDQRAGLQRSALLHMQPSAARCVHVRTHEGTWTRGAGNVAPWSRWGWHSLGLRGPPAATVAHSQQAHIASKEVGQPGKAPDTAWRMCHPDPGKLVCLFFQRPHVPWQGGSDRRAWPPLGPCHVTAPLPGHLPPRPCCLCSDHCPAPHPCTAAGAPGGSPALCALCTGRQALSGWGQIE